MSNSNASFNSQYTQNLKYILSIPGLCEQAIKANKLVNSLREQQILLADALVQLYHDYCAGEEFVSFSFILIS